MIPTDVNYSYYSSSSSMDYGLIVFWLLLVVGLAALMIVSRWKLFIKAGKPGWASIVPFYNSYVLCEIVFGQGLLFLLSFVPFVASVFGIICNYQLGKAFGKDVGFALGLIFFPIIFMPILAFGDSRYIGTTSQIKTGNTNEDDIFI